MNDDKSMKGISRRDMFRLMAGGGMMAVAGASLLGAAAPAMAAEVPKRGGSIRVAYDAGSVSDTLDPALGSTGADYIRFFMFYSGLTQLDKSLAPRMNLAESVESSDAKVWTIKLRRGVTFHDGKALTPADVVYSLMRHKDPKTASKVQTLLESFAEIKASGPNEVMITLTGANADLPVILATPQLVIVQDGTSDFKNGNGTGPYKVKQFQPGVSTIGTRNDNYFKSGQPYLDQIELIGISEDSARVNALLAGDVQLINAVNPRLTQRVAGTSGYEVTETKSGLYSDLIMRQDRPIVGSVDFALGMKYLFNRPQIQSAVFRGYAVIGNDQPIPPGHRYYDPSVPQRTFDLDKAKFHFQKAGAVGVTLPPVVASSVCNGSIEMAELMQQSAAQVGVNLKVDRVPGAGYWSNHWLKDSLGFGNINPRPSADVLFTQFFKSNAPWNESGWKNDRFDQLVTAARGEPDDAKRKQMYGEMQGLVSNLCSIGIPVFISLLDANDKRLKGLSAIPTGPMMGFSFAEYVWWAA